MALRSWLVVYLALACAALAAAEESFPMDTDDHLAMDRFDWDEEPELSEDVDVSEDEDEEDDAEEEDSEDVEDEEESPSNAVARAQAEKDRKAEKLAKEKFKFMRKVAKKARRKAEKAKVLAAAGHITPAQAAQAKAAHEAAKAEAAKAEAAHHAAKKAAPKAAPKPVQTVKPAMKSATSVHKSSQVFKLVRVKAHINTLEERIPVKKDQIEECKTKTDDLRDRKTKIAAKLKVTKAAYDKQMASLHGLMKKRNEIRQCKAKTNIDIKQATEKIHDLRKQARHFTSLIKSYKAEIEEEEGAIWNYNRELDMSEHAGEKQQIQQDIKDSKEIIEEAKNEIKDCKKSLGPITFDAKHYLKIRSDYRKEHKKCSSESAGVRAQLRAEKLKFATAILAFRHTKHQKRHLKAKLTRKAAECVALQQKLGELLKRKHDLHAKAQTIEHGKQEQH
eukprot:CAMPEP_0114560790 /NCGR_PEP_ID=MMETSP0114-20121206/11648_1 /TAXON_ID=31324 /ORGANISM="Goniomonas sp, Strain m" /LENGTH=447 /DNA_ID=CAMNT_0001746361 /DNA_START=1 /DNA_END=1344 /DNA_ORIENTATION=-